jgi:hypothetical protein
MMKEKKTITPAEVLKRCAWCNQYIPEDEEIFSLGSKTHPGVDLSDQEGGVILLEVGGKFVPALVPTSDSPAKEAGNDVLFVLCSQKCGRALQEALGKALGKRSPSGRRREGDPDDES